MSHATVPALRATRVPEKSAGPGRSRRCTGPRACALPPAGCRSTACRRWRAACGTPVSRRCWQRLAMRVARTLGLWGRSENGAVLSLPQTARGKAKLHCTDAGDAGKIGITRTRPGIRRRIRPLMRCMGYNPQQLRSCRLGMIKNRALWNKWETAHIRSRRPDFARSLRIVEALYAEARAFGVFDRPDFPDRLAHKIKLARAINVRTAAGTDRG